VDRVSLSDWSLEKSRVIHGLARNDLHFLDTNKEGDLILRIGAREITFSRIIEMVEEQNGDKPEYTSSFTLRFPQLISYQVRKLRAVFDSVISKMKYKGEFQAVYPIKVNQRRDVVLQVLLTDPKYGLEAGTKAELVLIKSVLTKEKHRLIICNGAKDPEYLQYIKECMDEGYNIGVSIESLHEANLIVNTLDPKETNLVFRMKPYLKVRGHWSHSAGRDSKFGLSIHDVFDVMRLLKEKGFLKAVTTILGHVGSQITAIEDFKPFARFMTRVYLELKEKGLENLDTIDFGGGLAIDYTSAHPENMMELYAQAIITGVKEELDDKKSKDSPNIMVESGRGLTALASMVLVKALELRSVFPPSDSIPESDQWVSRIRAASSISELTDLWTEFHTQTRGLAESLEELKDTELLIGVLRDEIRKRIAKLGIDENQSNTTMESFWHPDHIVIGNFSVFNSACDYVLVKQHFPILPIRDLHVRPESTVRLVDITCDSDGEISQFHRKGTGEIWFTEDYRPLTMPIAEMGQGIPVGYLQNVEGSYFAIALTGAYQDVIEMNHNLLGDLPDVEIILNKENKWQVRWVTGAEPIEDLLEEMGYIGFDVDEDPYMSNKE
jgi:arginine decarboxylase